MENIVKMGACAFVCLAAMPASAGHEAMQIVTPATTHWTAVPPSLPKGAEIAIIAGDPSKPGPFAFRVRTPANYRIGLHTHPSAENITVISGNVLHGMTSKKADAVIIRAGDFIYLPSHMAHALWSGSRPAIVQINGTGPFDITYVSPADDPRKSSRKH